MSLYHLKKKATQKIAEIMEMVDIWREKIMMNRTRTDGVK